MWMADLPGRVETALSRCGCGYATAIGFFRFCWRKWHALCFLSFYSWRPTMFSIRQKLILAFGGLLSVVAVIGVLTIVQIQYLGEAIDVILRENYQSVEACHEMKEAIERVDSGVLFTFLGAEDDGSRQIEAGLQRFSKALAVEIGNITLAGEGEKAHRLRELYHEYAQIIPSIRDAARPVDERREAYFQKLSPLFGQIKELAQEIQAMNQASMNAANDAARSQAESAQRRMTIAILACAAVGILFSGLTQRWILDPIRRLIESTNEIRRGNFELVLESRTRDEIGQLSDAFNAMAEGLRHIRRSARRDLIRTRKATSEVFKALPVAIAVLDLDERVEVSTEQAEIFFGLKPGVRIRDLEIDWLPPLIRKAHDEGRLVENPSGEAGLQVFRGSREYFFSPVVVPIAEGYGRGDISGTAIILKDVTPLREQQELKRSAVTTVSHQLRNPLTSIRMSLHLLLEEKLGALNAQQTELLLAAREESERLTGIVEELLDLDRMASGKTMMDMEPVSPVELVRDALEPLLPDARDKGIALTHTVVDDIPDVMGDAKRLQHVLANLLSNALRFTSPGGSVSVSAVAEEGAVRFAVADTGNGIAAEHLAQVFEPFFRGPGQEKPTGIGLGLAIVREIVKAHGGDVGAISEPGKGSTFWFKLPQAAGPDASATITTQEQLK
jgi:signal transduction histidine kinase/HAMP domain-containing protein